MGGAAASSRAGVGGMASESSMSGAFSLRAAWVVNASKFARGTLAGFLPASHAPPPVPLPARMPSEPSEGYFFIVRLPDGWQLCTCRHDEYGPMGLPDFWVETLDPFLNIWLAHFANHAGKEVASRREALEAAVGHLIAGYDAFPRGEVRRAVGKERFVVKHGGELTRLMHVSRREVEEAFSIRGRANWVVDPHFTSTPGSARRIRSLLPVMEKWEEH